MHMKSTQERLVIMKEIQSLITEWLEYVEDLGNECAYTDSILEMIQKKTKEL